MGMTIFLSMFCDLDLYWPLTTWMTSHMEDTHLYLDIYYTALWQPIRATTNPSLPYTGLDSAGLTSAGLTWTTAVGSVGVCYIVTLPERLWVGGCACMCVWGPLWHGVRSVAFDFDGFGLVSVCASVCLCVRMCVRACKCVIVTMTTWGHWVIWGHRQGVWLVLVGWWKVHIPILLPPCSDTPIECKLHHNNQHF